MMTEQLKAETSTSETAQASTPVPIIKYPLNGTRHNLGSFSDGTTWRYGRVWTRGVKDVKVRQILNGKRSDPSGQIEFIVR